MKKNHQDLLLEDHVYRNLTIALTLLFVSSPVLDKFFGSSRIDSYLIAGFLIFALYQITRRSADLVIGLALGIPAVASGIFNAATPNTPAINAIPTILGAAFLGFLVWRILKDVFFGHRITSEQIFGSVCAYLLIGLVFSSVYGFLFLVNPDAFAISDPLANYLAIEHEDQNFGIFTYFSFVTMTSLGYGDMAPISEMARTLAWIQADLGQLYLAITVAALVGIHIAQDRD
jgi:voltage-gated potassium channel